MRAPTAGFTANTVEPNSRTSRPPGRITGNFSPPAAESTSVPASAAPASVTVVLASVAPLAPVALPLVAPLPGAPVALPLAPLPAWTPALPPVPPAVAPLPGAPAELPAPLAFAPLAPPEDVVSLHPTCPITRTKPNAPLRRRESRPERTLPLPQRHSIPPPSKHPART